MSYTITSAKYANADGTVVEISTEEAGAVHVSERDNPDLWALLPKWGGIVDAYTPPEKREGIEGQSKEIKALAECVAEITGTTKESVDTIFKEKLSAIRLEQVRVS